MIDKQMEQMQQELRKEQKRVDLLIDLVECAAAFFLWTIPAQIVLGLVFSALAYWQFAAFAFGGAWLVTGAILYYYFEAEQKIRSRMSRKINKKWDDWNAARWNAEEARKSSSGVHMYT